MDLKEIPGTLGFTVDECGNIYDKDCNKRKLHKNGDGYITASVKTIDGRWVTFGVQRLVALSHLADSRKEDQNEVNHRNCDIENNCKYNLEWVTASQNNIHSEIMRFGNQYPTIIVEHISSALPIATCNNAHEASAIYNISLLDIWDSIKDSKEINGYRFKHRPFSGNIPSNLHKKTDPNKDKRGIKTLDIDTGDIEIFESFYSAAKRFNVTANHLYQSIPRNNVIRIFKKKYQVAYLEDDFPEINMDDLEKARNHGPRDVIAYDVVNKKYSIYNSAKEFIQMHNLSKKAITTALAKGRLRKIGSWIVTYLNQENVNKLKAFVECPATT